MISYLMKSVWDLKDRIPFNDIDEIDKLNFCQELLAIIEEIVEEKESKRERPVFTTHD